MIDYTLYIHGELRKFVEYEKIHDNEIASLCPSIHRDTIEEAKLGYTGNFVKKLKTEPIGCLMKINKVCTLKDSCSCYDSRICTTKTKKKIPACFYAYESSQPNDVIHHWADNAIVILRT